MPIYNSLNKYGHNNFVLGILEDLGPTNSVTKEFMLNREQYYLDILFSKESDLNLNNSPTAGTTLGFKHTKEFKLNRSGKLNPMLPSLADRTRGKIFSPLRPPATSAWVASGRGAEFLEMQIRDKSGINNPQARMRDGVKKSTKTLAKLTKLVYCRMRPYDYLTKNLIGTNIKRKFSNNAYKTSGTEIGEYLEINNNLSASVCGQLNP